MLEKLKRTDKAKAKAYAEEFKSAVAKLYDKKIACDKSHLDRYKKELDGTVQELKAALAKIKA